MFWLLVLIIQSTKQAAANSLEFGQITIVFYNQNGLSANFYVSVRDSNNAIVNIDNLIIYISLDNQGDLWSSNWKITTTGGVANGLIEYNCNGDYSLIADSYGYTSGTKILNQPIATNCPSITLLSNPYSTIIQGQPVTITAQLYSNNVILSATSLVLIEIYASSISGTTAVYNSGDVSAQITFLTAGKKKLLAVFSNIYSKTLLLDVYKNYFTISFPNGYVMIIQPTHTMMIFSVKIEVYYISTNLLDTTYNYDITITSSSICSDPSIVTKPAASGLVIFDGLYLNFPCDDYKTTATGVECFEKNSDTFKIENTSLKIAFKSAPVILI